MPFVATRYTPGPTRGTAVTFVLPATRPDGSAWAPATRDAIFVTVALEGARTVVDTELTSAGFTSLGLSTSSSTTTVAVWWKAQAAAADVNRSVTVTASASSVWAASAVVVPDLISLDAARPFRGASWVTAYFDTLTATSALPLRLLALGGVRGPAPVAPATTGPQMSYGPVASSLAAYNDGFGHVSSGIVDRRQVAVVAALTGKVQSTAVPEATSTLTAADGQQGAVSVGLHLAYSTTADAAPPPPDPAVTGFASGAYLPGASAGTFTALRARRGDPVAS